MNQCIRVRRGGHGGWVVNLEEYGKEPILLNHHQEVHAHSVPYTPPGWARANADARERGRWFDIPTELYSKPGVNTGEIAAIADNMAELSERMAEKLRRAAVFMRDQHCVE